MRLFRRIIELVDKDISSSSKPISIIGIALPFVPFMIFVDGAPADRYPILSGLALAASICWGLFVMWRTLLYLQVELAGPRKALGRAKFWLLAVGTVGFILLWAFGEIWFSDKIGWPEAYGFDCHGRGCFFEYLVHSHLLLRGSSIYELGLFATLWLLPAFLVAVLIYALFKRSRGIRNRIEPLD